MKQVFPAIHELFYKEFDSWRKSNKVKNQPKNGVYRLLVQKQIGRLLGEDDEGTLYIGKGVILSNSNRIGKFINAVNNTENRHGGGKRFTSDKIMKRYPLRNAIVEITLTKDPEGLESQFLSEYNDKFGEMPPFNRRMEYK